ncbi:MAG: malonate transporter subunit MadL [Alphaproteobacteria bacterium]|nr:malonate transporter subunit MadL [Alphaproteobacteria bacterium]
MTIYGVALLAVCTLLGAYFGDLLGAALGVKANVGGVGIAMVLLVSARLLMTRRGDLPSDVRLGVIFWSMMYIPIVVAMAAQQNVVAAVKGGPVVFLAGTLSVVVSFFGVAILGRAKTPPPEPNPMRDQNESERP